MKQKTVNLKLRRVTALLSIAPTLEQPVYHLQQRQSAQRARQARQRLTSWATVDFTGIAGVTVGRIGAFRPTASDLIEPLRVQLPPVSIAVTPRLQVLPTGVDSFTQSDRHPASAVPARHTTRSTGASGHPAEARRLLLRPRRTDSGWNLAEDKDPHPIQRAIRVVWSLQPVDSITDDQRLHKQAFTLQAVATEFHHDFTEGFRRVGYPGIPYTNYYTPAKTRTSSP